MKTLKTLAACAAFVPMAAFADGTEVTEAQLEAFRVAIAGVGCSITDEASANQVEMTTGYSEAVLEAIVEQLRVYDEIVDASADGGITLVTGDCAA